MSVGIPQGLFTSDYLGDFFLTEVDEQLLSRQVKHFRYVDDMNIQFPDRESAERFKIDIAEILRTKMLQLNESKTKIMNSKAIRERESKIHTLFEQALSEREAYDLQDFDGYNVIALESLDDSELQEIHEDYERDTISATYSLLESIDSNPEYINRIEKHCLPILAHAGDDIYFQRALARFKVEPHLSGLYEFYLRRFCFSSTESADYLQSLFLNYTPYYQWQYQHLIRLLSLCEHVSDMCIQKLMVLYDDTHIVEPIRCLAAICIAKKGRPNQRRHLVSRLNLGMSDNLKCSLMFCSQYFTDNDRRRLLRQIGNSSLLTTLMSKALTQSRL